MSVARRLLGDYEAYRIFAVDAAPVPPPLPVGWRIAPVDAAVRSVLENHPDAKVRVSAGFVRLPGRALFDGDVLLGTVFFEAASPGAALWPPFANRTALADLLVLPEHRGRGAAAHLIAQGAHACHPGEPLFAWGWWSNHAAAAAFARAGWRTVGRVFGGALFGRGPVRRLRLDSGGLRL
jgi:GNAT superfamily N-acetyltransferase